MARKVLGHAQALPAEEAAALEGSDPPWLSTKLLQPYVSLAARCVPQHPGP